MYIKDFDPFKFSKKKIGGVDVYYKNLPWAPCVNINFVFNVGGFSDPVGKEGLSHFLEHMIFDGSPKLKDKKIIKEWSKKYALGSWGAWTSLCQTTYHLRCLPEHYKEVISGMKDMIFNSYIRNEDVEHERKVITEEAWGRYKNEKYLAYIKETSENIYHGHSLSRIQRPLGWPETISEITQEDLKNWHSKKYVKENLSIVMTGMVTDEHLDYLEGIISDLPSGEVNIYDAGKIGKPKENKIIKNTDDIGDPKDRTEITISRFLPDIDYEEAEKAKLSRFFIADLVHERFRIESALCYSVSTRLFLQRDASNFLMNVDTKEENIEKVQNDFWGILSAIEKGEHKDRFETLKKLYIEWVKSKETLSEDIAYSAIKNIEKYEGKIKSREEEIKGLEKVLFEDVQDFIKNSFKKDHVFTEILLSSKK